MMVPLLAGLGWVLQARIGITVPQFKRLVLLLPPHLWLLKASLAQQWFLDLREHRRQLYWLNLQKVLRFPADAQEGAHKRRTGERERSRDGENSIGSFVLSKKLEAIA